MKEVGVREFRDHATFYLSGAEPIAVTKHGHTIGVYMPFKNNYEQRKRAIEELGRAVNRVLEETGMTEDELVDMFDISKPLPE